LYSANNPLKRLEAGEVPFSTSQTPNINFEKGLAYEIQALRKGGLKFKK
jgi:hypothetical protein